MSGWIKFEKGLRTNPKFRRMVSAIVRNGDVTQQRISHAMAETLLLGCLAKLWMDADDHIRSDDTLDMSADEIDELVGVAGFCQVMPADWLQVIDPQHVKLPGFQEHNGTDAKRKALTQKRVARHRIRTVTQERVDDDRVCNASALPDRQTIRDRQTHRGTSASRETEPEPEIREHVMAIKARYPKAVREDWITGEKNARSLVLSGDATWPELVAGVERYARLCKATGRMVLNPANFFGAIDRPWSQPWELPSGRPEARPRNDEAAWAEQKARAAALGFREPHPKESVDVYRTAINMFESTPVSRRVTDRIGDAAAALRVGT